MAEVIKSTPQELITSATMVALPETLSPLHPSTELILQEQKPLTPEYAAELFYQSFYHSQGSQPAQDALFVDFAGQNPHWFLTDEDAYRVYKISAKKILKKARDNNHPYTDNDSGDYLTKRIDTMRSKLNSDFKSRIRPDYFLDTLIRQDAIYLGSQFPEYGDRAKARIRNIESTEPNENDKWFSFVCHFGFNENPTGFEELDRIYKEIVSYARSGQIINRETDGALDFVIRNFNKHHPGQEVRL